MVGCVNCSERWIASKWIDLHVIRHILNSLINTLKTPTTTYIPVSLLKSNKLFTIKSISRKIKKITEYLHTIGSLHKYVLVIKLLLTYLRLL